MENNRFSRDKWKYLSFGLMAVILTPGIIAAVSPQAFADASGSIQSIVTAIRQKVDTNLDAKVSTRATKTSFDAIAAKVGKNVMTFDTTIEVNRDFFVPLTDANATNIAFGGVLSIDVSGLSSGHVEIWCINNGGIQVGRGVQNGEHYEIAAVCQQFMIENSIFSGSSANVHGTLSYDVLYKQ